MKKSRSPRVKEIQAEPKNKIFFENAKFHGDKQYKVGKINSKEILEVLTNHGWVRYEIFENVIGDCIFPADLK